MELFTLGENCSVLLVTFASMSISSFLKQNFKFQKFFERINLRKKFIKDILKYVF